MNRQAARECRVSEYKQSARRGEKRRERGQPIEYERGEKKQQHWNTKQASSKHEKVNGMGKWNYLGHRQTVDPNKVGKHIGAKIESSSTFRNREYSGSDADANARSFSSSTVHGMTAANVQEEKPKKRRWSCPNVRQRHGNKWQRVASPQQNFHRCRRRSAVGWHTIWFFIYILFHIFLCCFTFQLCDYLLVCLRPFRPCADVLCREKAKSL